MKNLEKLIPVLRGKGIIHLKTHDRHLSLDPGEILFCKAAGSYTRVVIENCHDILVSKSLKVFQKIISDERFLRCHYSYLINVSKIQSFNSKKKIVVLGRYFIPVSRRKSNNIFRILSLSGIKDVKSGSLNQYFMTK